MKGVFDGPKAAVLAPKGRALVARPLFERGNSIQLKQERKRSGSRQLKPGELVIVEPAGIAKGKHRGRPVIGEIGRIIRRVGSPDNPRDVIEALMIERGLERRFPGRVERYAADAAASEDEFERRDLSDVATFTMDPEGAKDYDDAVSATREDDGSIRVWVHIADVSSFVRPGDPVDEEAYRRATSVYVPGAVEPMLPEALSNVACSLVPGEPRRAVSVEMLFDGHDVVQAAFHRTTIESDKRLTYGMVDEIFAGRATADAPWDEPLALAREVAAALAAERERRSALAVESLEPVFEFDAAGAATEVHHEEQTESHKVIEHLMIAANEAVATYLEEHKHAALFRVHEKPEPRAVERLVGQLASLGVPTPPLPDHFTPQQAETFVGQISAQVVRHVKSSGKGRIAYTSLVLRSLKQAVYAPKNLGHSGLRSPRYCHFTSPIRRYPDLIVHRALLTALGIDDAAPRANGLTEAAEWTSTKEREAMQIERKADDISRTFLLKRALEEQGWTEASPAGGRRPDRDDAREAARSGPAFEGEITGMVGGGLFVAFGPELLYEGFLPLRELKELRGGYWNLNQFETAMVDDNSGHTISLGDRIEVRVLGVEPARGRVDLLPVSV